MRARQAKYPRRIKLTFEDGSTKIATWDRADEPLVEGDPLNPYTLLKDETCILLGGDPETMVPDDALNKIKELVDKAQTRADAAQTRANDTFTKAQTLTAATAELYGLGKDAVPDSVLQVLANVVGRYKIGVNLTILGKAAGSGIVVQGITTAAGGVVRTNSAGYAEGYTYEKVVTLTVEEQFTDVQGASVTVDTMGRVFTKTTIALVSTSGQIEITSSQTVRFSPAVKTVDAFLVGGGGSGAIEGTAYRNADASGGAGGYTATRLALPLVGQQIVCAIGAGGEKATLKAPSGFNGGRAGGTTVVTSGSITVSAAGGNGGGSGNGSNGGSGGGGSDSTNGGVAKGGSDGSDSAKTYNNNPGKGQGTTTTAFGEGTGIKYAAGGGGACCKGSSERTYMGDGGADGGGAGNGSSATTPGSGGGACISAGNNGGTVGATSGSGADGLVILRWETGK